MKIQSEQGLFVQNRYTMTNNNLNKTIQKIASGYQINSAADNAAGLAISEKMRGQIRGLEQASENIEDACSFINVADSAMGTISSPHLQRIRELCIQAANDTLTNDERSKIQVEVDELINEIDHIANDTEFNKINVLRPEYYNPPITVTGVVDLVIVFDDTTSMSSIQQQVANNLTGLLDTITGRGINDIRVGLVEYNQTVTLNSINGDKWTTDIAEAKQQIQQIASQNVGGIENVFTAVQTVINSYDFRDNQNAKSKHILIVTDEPGNDTQLLNQVSSLANKSNIQVHGAYGNAYPYDFSSIDSLVSSTGGKSVNLTHTNWGSDLANNIGLAIADGAGIVTEASEMPSLKIQVGPNEGQHVLLEMFDCRSHKLGIKNLDLSTRENADNAISIVDAAIEKITSYRTIYGAKQNRFEHTLNNVQVTYENLQKSESILRDTDIAKETSNLQRHQVLLQSSQSMMAQINQMSQGILKILG